MIALQIQDIKNFMSKLLLSQTFDHFQIVEGAITTFNTFHIEGRIHRDFFTAEELEELEHREFSLWKEVKPFCLELIKGKKVAIVDDVVSTGASLAGLEKLVEKAGGIIYKKAFALAEDKAAERDDVIFLNTIPVFFD